MRLIPAIALDRPREVSTKYGQRLVIDCMARETGEKITLWRGVDDDYSRRYVIKNSPITIGIDSKGKHSLIENEALTNLGKPLPETVPVKPVHTYTTPPQSDPNFSPDKKAEMAEYVANLASLYQHCQDKAEDIALTPDDCRAIATTLFIQTVKKFAI